MISFATVNDYIIFSGISEVPADAQFLINRANELVYHRIKENYRPQNANHVAAAKNAVCAQVMYWVAANISPIDTPFSVGFSLGDISMEKGGTESANPTTLCPLALSYLRSECLTYKGLRNCCMGQQV